MKHLYLSVTFLATSASCSAMQSLIKQDPVRQVRFYNKDERALTLSFRLTHLTLNDTNIPYSDASNEDTLNSVITICTKRYEYLSHCWNTTSHNQVDAWFEWLQSTCLEEMIFLKKDLLGELCDPLTRKSCFLSGTFAGELIKNALSLFEQFHSLRIDVCREWPEKQLSAMNLQAHLSQINEQEFQGFAHRLNTNINVSPWFKRMRKKSQ